MNAEHQALAEYLEERIDERLSGRFDSVDDQLKDISRNLKNLTIQVDDKNDMQDEEIGLHEIRIRALESTVG